MSPRFRQVSCSLCRSQDGTDARPQPITCHSKVCEGLEHVHGASLAAPGTAGLSPLQLIYYGVIHKLFVLPTGVSGAIPAQPQSRRVGGSCLAPPSAHRPPCSSQQPGFDPRCPHQEIHSV